MQRRGLAWLLALPLVTAGSLSAHALAYRIAEPLESRRAELLDSTGHGYLSATPFLLGACLAFLVAGLIAAANRVRAGAPGVAPAWPLALVAPLGFVAQEHIERLAATGSFPLELVAQPGFLAGVALQLPFALLAVAAARWLGRTAEALGCVLAGRPSAGRPAASVLVPCAEPLLPPAAPLLSGRSERGPPRSV